MAAAPPGSSPRFRAPDTMLIIFSIIVLAAVATWFVPPGAFEKATIEVEGAGEREVVVPGSFDYLEREDEGWFDRVRGTLGIILLAPILGITDPDAVPIIAFVLLVGGAFAVLQKTGAVDAGLRRLVGAAEQSRAVQLALIPLFMTLFSLGGATFGMAEETIPFVLIFVPLALALGYDSITGVAIPFVGSGAGFAGAFLNPFTVGVAQGIAEVPLFSGVPFRIGLWVCTTAAATGFVMWHAARVKRDPKRSPTYALDQKKRAEEGLDAPAADAALTASQRNVLLVFAVGLVVLVFGVLEFGWYINEIAALFVALGIVMGLVGGLGGNGTAMAFQEGARDLVATALIIGLARGILIVLQDAQVIDTILYALASTVGDFGPAVAASTMYGAQTVLNFFVPSGSGQAALTMPLMAPLADLVGVSRQTAVLAFQMGDGFTNLIIPTSAVLMGALSLANVPWQAWARWILPLQLVLFAMGVVALVIAVSIGWTG
ncbi:MAG: YfcC family protein [Bacteroidota bacterium]